jgi:uncharacterized protein (DUF1684 family)
MKANLFFKPILLLLIVVTMLLKCTTGVKNETSYREEMSNWRMDRLERLKSPDGWLNLIGLLWIKNGVNTFGSDSSNNLIFPAEAPAKAGIISLKDSIVTIHFNNNEGVLIDDQPSKDCELFADITNHQTHVQLGRYAFTIIKRGNKYGIRLRDMESPLLGHLDSIPAFPVSAKWRVKAKLEKFTGPKSFEVNTVIGIPEIYKAPGKLLFKLNGKDCSLIPFNEDDHYFIIFGDETSSIATYPAGRFLNAGKVDSTGYTALDFNKATNPPCAFTPYATCPLPLRDNILSLKVEAGEKDVHLYKH